MISKSPFVSASERITPCLNAKGGFFCACLKVLSFIYPIRLQQLHSEFSGPIEIVLRFGKVEVNNHQANYSFGNLHRVFSYILNKYSSIVRSKKNILILGFGAGSIYEILRNELNYPNQITGVEIDPLMIRLFRTRNKSDDDQLTIEICDALSYLTRHKNAYDLILIDLFKTLEHSPLLHKTEFIELLKQNCSEDGMVLFNTIFHDKDPKLSSFAIDLHQMFRHVKRQHVMYNNYIFIASDIVAD